MRCKAPQPFEISEFDELHEHSSSNASVLERLSKELDSRLKDQRGHCTFHVAVVRTATRTPKQHTVSIMEELVSGHVGVIDLALST